MSECWGRFKSYFDMSLDYDGSNFDMIVKHEHFGTGIPITIWYQAVDGGIIFWTHKG